MKEIRDLNPSKIGFSADCFPEAGFKICRWKERPTPDQVKFAYEDPDDPLH